MTNLRSSIAHRAGAFLCALCVFIGIGCLRAQAGVAVDPYQAIVGAPDRSDAGLSAAFQAAMRQVLVRATGRRSAARDPEYAPLIQNARRYMQQYRAGSGNQIWVSFDGSAIERWLLQNSQPLWGRERPVTAVWLAAAGRANASAIITRDDTSELKRALDQAAAARGIVLAWPANADVQRAQVSASTLGQTAPALLTEASRRMGADGVLVGRADNSSAGAGVRWVFDYQGRNGEIVGAEDGIDHAADVYAQMYAASGTSAAVDVEVTGVGTLSAYAAAQSTLESMTLVSRVNVVGFDQDALRLTLMARGGADALRRLLAQDSRVELQTGGDPALVRFRLRQRNL